MKKFVSSALLLSFLLSNNLFACANNNVDYDTFIKNKDNIPRNVQIKKGNNKKYGVISKDTNETVIPFNYKKIKKLGDDTVLVKQDKSDGYKVYTNDNKPVIDREIKNIKLYKIDKDKQKTIDNSIFIGKTSEFEYIAAIPSKSSKHMIKDMIEQNNKISNIKFYNYPENGVILYQKDGKWGYIVPEDEYYKFTTPQFIEYAVPDEDTLIFKHLNISFAPTDTISLKSKKTKEEFGGIKSNIWYKISKSHNITQEPSRMIEQINTTNNEIQSTFKQFANTDAGEFIYYPDKKDDNFYLYDKNKAEYIRSNSILTQFKNFPTTGIFLTNGYWNGQTKYGLNIKTDNKVKIIPNMYDDFYFPDKNYILYKRKQQSLSNPNRICAKKDGKWGIINSDNTIIVDFQYDDMFSLPAIDKNEITYDEKEKKYTVTYKGIDFSNSNILFVSNGENTEIIDKNGKVKVPMQPRFDIEKIKSGLSAENQDIVNQIYKTQRKKEKRAEMTKNTGIFIGKTLEFPFKVKDAAITTIAVTAILVPVMLVIALSSMYEDIFR